MGIGDGNRDAEIVQPLINVTRRRMNLKNNKVIHIGNDQR